MAPRSWSFRVLYYILLWVGSGSSEEGIVHFQGKGIQIEAAGSSAT